MVPQLGPEMQLILSMLANLVKLRSGQQVPCHPVHACRAVRVDVVHELFEGLGPDVGNAQLFHLRLGF